MSVSREAIAACARSWIGTRFVHQGRLKRCTAHSGGVDCLGLLAGVAKELDLRTPDGRLLADCDQQDYPRYPDTDMLRDTLERLLMRVEEGEMREGDVLLLTVEGRAQHLAIAGRMEDGELSLIHAYAQAGRVVEHRLDALWREAIAGVFRVI